MDSYENQTGTAFSCSAGFYRSRRPSKYEAGTSHLQRNPSLYVSSEGTAAALGNRRARTVTLPLYAGATQLCISNGLPYYCPRKYLSPPGQQTQVRVFAAQMDRSNIFNTIESGGLM
jgi:hypothetical protein